MSAHDEQQANERQADHIDRLADVLSSAGDTVLIGNTLERIAALKAGAAALRRASPETGWQPISTAPKDGTKVVLLIEHDQAVVASWQAIEDFAMWVTAGEDDCPNSWEGFGCYADSDQPTHWQPLPPAPLPQEAE